jgi:hypothetical protein
MKIWNQKNKMLIITQIINMIKKYNISIDDIIKEYINAYKTQFPTDHQILYIKQYNYMCNLQKKIENYININDEDFVIINKNYI